MSEYWRLTVRDEFSAGHALPGYPGKCENMHGHNFAVELSVEGDKPDPVTGMLVDFSFLKKNLAAILAGLDHRILNELPAFAGQSPSSENIARHIGREMLAVLTKTGIACDGKVRLASVSVSEKGAQTAIWICDS